MATASDNSINPSSMALQPLCPASACSVCAFACVAAAPSAGAVACSACAFGIATADDCGGTVSTLAITGSSQCSKALICGMPTKPTTSEPTASTMSGKVMLRGD